MEDVADPVRRCRRCGGALISCFAGTHEGAPVRARYYCQRDRLSLVVLADEAIELPDLPSPAIKGETRLRALVRKIGSAWRRR